jgi:hypothetical protein
MAEFLKNVMYIPASHHKLYIFMTKMALRGIQVFILMFQNIKQVEFNTNSLKKESQNSRMIYECIRHFLEGNS